MQHRITRHSYDEPETLISTDSFAESKRNHPFLRKSLHETYTQSTLRSAMTIITFIIMYTKTSNHDIVFHSGIYFFSPHIMRTAFSRHFFLTKNYKSHS